VSDTTPPYSCFETRARHELPLPMPHPESSESAALTRSLPPAPRKTAPIIVHEANAKASTQLEPQQLSMTYTETPSCRIPRSLEQESIIHRHECTFIVYITRLKNLKRLRVNNSESRIRIQRGSDVPFHFEDGRD
jgi:hypothetical protein